MNRAEWIAEARRLLLAVLDTAEWNSADAEAVETLLSAEPGGGS